VVFALSVPGSVSDWIELDEAARDYAAGLGEYGEEIARRAELLRGVAVRVRVLPRGEMLALHDRMRALGDDDPEYISKADALDADTMAAGLVEVRGVEPPDLERDKLLEALAACKLHTIIARAVATHSSLTPQERAGFFTRAQEPPAPSSAVDAPKRASGR